MVSDLSVISATYGPVPDECAMCMELARSVYPEVEAMRFPPVENPLRESDRWRWDCFLTIDNVLWIDWDLYPRERLALGRPAFAEYRGLPDNCLVYSPAREYFEALEEDRKQRGISFSTYGWFRKLLRNAAAVWTMAGLPGKYDIVPENLYCHLRYSGTAKLKKQYETTTGCKNHHASICGVKPIEATELIGEPLP